MQISTTSPASHSYKVGLHIHSEKTKVLKINTSGTETVKFGDNNLEEVKYFTYIGSVINHCLQGGTDADVKTCIEMARISYEALKSICQSHLISSCTKIQPSDSKVESVL
jgi:hypothetical protein